MRILASHWPIDIGSMVNADYADRALLLVDADDARYSPGRK